MKIIRLWENDGDLRCRNCCRQEIEIFSGKSMFAAKSGVPLGPFSRGKIFHWRLPLRVLTLMQPSLLFLAGIAALYVTTGKKATMQCSM